MKGQATPNMASGKAMAKKASKARMKNKSEGYFRKTEWRMEGRCPDAQEMIRRRQSISGDDLQFRSRHALTQGQRVP